MTLPPSGSTKRAPHQGAADIDPLPTSSPSDTSGLRATDLNAVMWSVDCITEHTFLYAPLCNISEMGIFVATLDPLPIGTQMTLRFAPPGTSEPFECPGRVHWINRVRPLADNPNPGMGIRFLDLTIDARERLVDAIHTIAYLRYDVS